MKDLKRLLLVFKKHRKKQIFLHIIIGSNCYKKRVHYIKTLKHSIENKMKYEMQIEHLKIIVIYFLNKLFNKKYNNS